MMFSVALRVYAAFAIVTLVGIGVGVTVYIDEQRQDEYIE